MILLFAQYRGVFELLFGKIIEIQVWGLGYIAIFAPKSVDGT